MSKLHEKALAVQNASNLAGVSRSFGEIVGELSGKVPDNVDRRKWLAEHPVFILFLDKVLDLAGWSDRDLDRYCKAHNACEEAVKAGQVKPESVEAVS